MVSCTLDVNSGSDFYAKQENGNGVWMSAESGSKLPKDIKNGGQLYEGAKLGNEVCKSVDLRSSVSKVTKGEDQKTEKEKSLRPDNIPIDRTRWIVLLICFWVDFVSLGFLFGLGVMFVEIVESFQSSRAEAAFIQTLCFGFTYCASPVTGVIIGRLGPGLSTILGGFVATVGILCGYFAPNVFTLIILIGAVTGFGIGMCNLSAYVCVGHLFHDKKGLGAYVIVIGAGLGSVISPLLYAVMLEEYGWRGTFLLYSGIMFHNCAFGLIIYAFTKQHKFRSEKPASTKKKFRLTEILNLYVFKNMRYTIFLLLAVPAWLFVTAEVVFIVDIVSNNGFPLTTASLALSAINFSQIFGVLIIGLIRKIFSLSSLACFGGALFVCALTQLGIVETSNYALLITLAVMFGLALGVLYCSEANAILEISGLPTYTASLGFYFGGTGIADALCGPVGGATKDLTGSYNMMFYIATAVNILTGTAIFILVFFSKKKSRDVEGSVLESTETIVTRL